MSHVLSLWVSFLLSSWVPQSVALTACFTESPFASTCEPATSAPAPGGIRGCFRPDLPPSDDSGGASVSWNPATGACVRRPTVCGSFAACQGRCLVSCGVAARGFLVLSLRVAVGVKSFTLIDTPALSNSSVRGMPDAAQLPSVFRADVLDQLASVQPLLTFKEIVVSLFVANAVVLNVTFDLTQSPSTLTRTNWFSLDRLKNSWPVTDLKNKTFNYFSIQGDGDRRFYINYNYYFCPAVTGFMMALDNSDSCSWEGSFTAAPKFIYSTQPGTKYSSSAPTADLMAIVLR